MMKTIPNLQIILYSKAGTLNQNIDITAVTATLGVTHQNIK